MRKLIFLLAVFAFISNCNGQKSKNPLLLSEFSFKSIFGTSKIDSTNAFCLLGTGFFRAPSSDNSDSLILTWINSHPKSIVIPVSSVGPTMTKAKNSKITFCWLVDGNDTINNFLIRNGCFPGGTMQRPKTWGEMSSREKSFFRGQDKPKVEILIDNKSYTIFIEQIKRAEKFASDKKLGIWLNPDKFH